jgi:hypothetical protein
MSFEEALEFLNVSADTASDSIEASAVALVRRVLLTLEDIPYHHQAR